LFSGFSSPLMLVVVRVKVIEPSDCQRTICLSVAATNAKLITMSGEFAAVNNNNYNYNQYYYYYTEAQTDRQTDTQTERETNRQTDRQTNVGFLECR